MNGSVLFPSHPLKLEESTNETIMNTTTIKQDIIRHELTNRNNNGNITNNISTKPIKSDFYQDEKGMWLRYDIYDTSSNKKKRIISSTSEKRVAKGLLLCHHRWLQVR